MLIELTPGIFISPKTVVMVCDNHDGAVSVVLSTGHKIESPCRDGEDINAAVKRVVRDIDEKHTRGPAWLNAKE